jgi:hypothetical protein
VHCWGTEHAAPRRVRLARRPVIKEVQKEVWFPPVKTAWTVESKLGGWDSAQKKFFDDQGILDKIQRKVGESRLAQRLEEKKRNSWLNWQPWKELLPA